LREALTKLPEGVRAERVVAADRAGIPAFRGATAARPARRLNFVVRPSCSPPPSGMLGGRLGRRTRGKVPWSAHSPPTVRTQQQAGGCMAMSGNPRLRQAILDVVENQLRDGTPPEAP